MKLFRSAWSRIAGWGVATFKKAGVRQWALATAVFLTLSAVLLANVVTERIDLQVGQVATRDISAPQRVLNRYATEARRAAAEDEALLQAVADPSNYVINLAVEVRARESVDLAFKALMDARAQGLDAEAARREIAARSGIDLPSPDVQQALELGEEELADLSQAVVDAVSQALRGERIGEEEVEEVRAGLGARIEAAAGQRGVLLSAAAVQLGVKIGAPAVQPNLVLDMQRVNRATEAAARNVEPVYVERSQTILRRGDLVTEEHIQILQDLGMVKARSNYLSALGLVLVVALLTGLFGVYLYQHQKGILQDDGHLALLGLVLVLVVGIAKVLSFFPSDAAGYLVPVALGTMLIGILLDAHVAVVAAVFLSVIVGVVMGYELRYALVALASGLAGVFSTSRVGERSHLARAGLLVGVVTFGTMAALGLLHSDMALVRYSPLGVINGLLSAVGTIGLFPYLETLFGITSSIRLLELSNPNHPLLRKLLMEAPGTYHHSMIVGNLAEAAAEAIGGDSLLARVGAQYHDIGKVKRPYFFVENQYGGENPHDKIAPSLSTLIITSHVKDGVELAQQHRLPECVIAFIREHHGTSLVKYFYHKALENAKADGAKDEKCDENDFRYPGPRPQSKETAIVLLADSVEAAVRSLVRPTPGRIEGLVRKIVKDHLADGQLDESNITLRDLDKICEAFVRVLTGIYHKRVEYPESFVREMEAKRASKTGT